ncbi:hypothetical protein C8J56DRAFT_786307, partial [Mycena floridula]
FTTIPIGPQLQALWHHPDTTRKLQHYHTDTQRLIKEVDEIKSIKAHNSIYCGLDYLHQVCAGDIKGFDNVLILSGDGGQLYRNKGSSAYMRVCIVCEFDGTTRSLYPLAAQLTSPISEKDTAIMAEWKLVIGLGEIRLLK